MGKEKSGEPGEGKGKVGKGGGERERGGGGGLVKGQEGPKCLPTANHTGK